MTEPVTISKEIDNSLTPEYGLLREEGLQYIRELASAIWTDYNTHDPGITTLEMFCYALTDLNYRCSLPVEDLVASEADNTRRMHEQFLSAIRVMPNYPVTENDYRQALIRIDGIRNAWLTRSPHAVVVNYKQTGNKSLLHYKQPGETINTDEEIEFNLQGLTSILLDFEEFPELEGDAAAIEVKQAGIIKQVKSVYHFFRNLCEDLDEIKIVEKQEIVVCAEIELEAKADPEMVWAQIIAAIENYLNPDISFYSLKELLKKGMGTDEIFEGPVFNFDAFKGIDQPIPFAKQGFVIEEELEASGLRTEIRLSDLYRVIMKIGGVKIIKKISFTFCGCNEVPGVAAQRAANATSWLLCVDPKHKPVLCTNNSSFTFYKDVIPIELKKAEAEANLNAIRNDKKAKIKAKKTEDLPIPEGSYQNVKHYETLQNQFPETYGISPAGLPETATTERKALALQLKGYLIFFDQVLANYFSQLANAGTLLSADDDVKKTYFGNVVNGIKDVEKVMSQSAGWENAVEKIMRENGLDNYPERKNKFLDHLLARFAEQFNEYVFILYRIYGEDYQRSIIRHKIDFLKEYDQMSACRGTAVDLYNKKDAAEDLLNVSGMEKRVSRLLGFTNYERQSLTQEDYLLFKPDAQHYNFHITKSGIPVFKGNANYLKEFDALEAMGLVAILACDRENYVLQQGSTPEKVIYNIANAKGELLTLNDMEIDIDDAEIVIRALIGFMRREFKTEGMYVVENILLRPAFDYTGDNAGNHRFMPVCVDPNGDFCNPVDPYSFRICVVLPGESLRFRNMAFRKYAEKLIRTETPAHIMPRICFIGRAQMEEFETLYGRWLEAKRDSVRQNTPMDVNLNTEFIELLERLYSVYPQGELNDCDDDTDNTNPIILNQTNLGSLQGGGMPL